MSFIEDVSGLFDRRWSSLEDPESGDVKKCSTCHASALDAQCDPPTPEVCEEENGCFTLIYAHEERHREVTGEYSTCSDREARIDRENPPASLLLRKPTLESGIEHEGGKRWSGPDEAAPGDPYNVILRWIQQGAQLDTAPPPACVGTD